MTFREEFNPDDAFRKEREKRKRKILAQVIISTVLITLLFAFVIIVTTPRHFDRPTACFKHGVCIDLIIVSEPEAMRTGLSNYSYLPDNTGMLFIFDKADKQRMWMKDMKFPIDILWLNDNGRITHMEKSAEPCTSESDCLVYESFEDAKYVLEVYSGFAKKYNLYDADTVDIRLR